MTVTPGRAELGPVTLFGEPSTELRLSCGACRSVSVRVIFGVPSGPDAFAAASAQLFADSERDGWTVEPLVRCPDHQAARAVTTL